MTLLFVHTHDLDLEVSRSKFKIALFQEWEDQLSWYEKDESHPFMTMTLTFVTMEGRMTVVTSDMRRAIHISSLSSYPIPAFWHVPPNIIISFFPWQFGMYQQTLVPVHSGMCADILCIYIYICVCMYIYMYICIYIYLVIFLIL